MTHALKTVNPYYDEVVKGNKTFEVRKHDRPFKIGDKLLLQQYIHEGNQIGSGKSGYTGAEEMFVISYILEGGQFGIEKGFCVLGIKEIEKY